MARLEDIPEGERNMMEGLDCTGFEGRLPWVTGPSLSERRVAILSTAALNLRGDAGFAPAHPWVLRDLRRGDDLGRSGHGFPYSSSSSGAGTSCLAQA